ncbi:MAG: hypothetical protein HPY68_06610 [Candidatus Atribacteria bacterium]|nr:hypothetical protein [Candidatus Atribacteria bacterium]
MQYHLGIQEVRQISWGPRVTTGELSLPSRSYPLLFLAENHAFTAFAYQYIVSRFPREAFFLLILDTHLDIFPDQENPETLHRGNFLRYLLERGMIEEEHLFVSPLQNPLSSLREALNRFGEGFYYLSWDLDFGLPRYACFSSPLHLPFLDLQEIFRLLGRHLRKPKRHLIGMDIVEMNLSDFYFLPKLAFQIATLLQYLAPQKLARFGPAHLDRLHHSKYAKYAQWKRRYRQRRK